MFEGVFVYAEAEILATTTSTEWNIPLSIAWKTLRGAETVETVPVFPTLRGVIPFLGTSHFPTSRFLTLTVDIPVAPDVTVEAERVVGA